LKSEIGGLKLNISEFSDEILSFSVNDVQIGFQWVQEIRSLMKKVRQLE